MVRALVLNASYEPLAVVSARRALVLVLDCRADLVQRGDGEWHSERLAVPVPSVVRLRRYVTVPFRRRLPLSRRAVFLRDGESCQYCGRRAENLDHVVPRSRGGRHIWENVVACCTRCNVAKRDRLLGETSLHLRSVPVAPDTSSWVRLAVGRVPDAWQPYLLTDATRTPDSLAVTA